MVKSSIFLTTLLLASSADLKPSETMANVYHSIWRINVSHKERLPWANLSDIFDTSYEDQTVTPRENGTADTDRFRQRRAERFLKDSLDVFLVNDLHRFAALSAPFSTEEPCPWLTKGLKMALVQRRYRKTVSLRKSLPVQPLPQQSHEGRFALPAILWYFEEPHFVRENV